MQLNSTKHLLIDSRGGWTLAGNSRTILTSVSYMYKYDYQAPCDVIFGQTNPFYDLETPIPETLPDQYRHPDAPRCKIVPGTTKQQKEPPPPNRGRSQRRRSPANPTRIEGERKSTRRVEFSAESVRSGPQNPKVGQLAQRIRAHRSLERSRSREERKEKQDGLVTEPVKHDISKSKHRTERAGVENAQKCVDLLQQVQANLEQKLVGKKVEIDSAFEESKISPSQIFSPRSSRVEFFEALENIREVEVVDEPVRQREVLMTNEAKIAQSGSINQKMIKQAAGRDTGLAPKFNAKAKKGQTQSTNQKSVNSEAKNRKAKVQKPSTIKTDDNQTIQVQIIHEPNGARQEPKAETLAARLVRDLESSGRVGLSVGCSCHRESFLPVEKRSQQFHTCFVCKQKVDETNPHFSMLSCPELILSHRAIEYGVNDQKSICSECLWSNLWTQEMSQAIIDLSAEELKVTNKNRNKQMLLARPEHCMFCTWQGYGSAALSQHWEVCDQFMNSVHKKKVDEYSKPKIEGNPVIEQSVDDFNAAIQRLHDEKLRKLKLE